MPAAFNGLKEAGRKHDPYPLGWHIAVQFKEKQDVITISATIERRKKKKKVPRPRCTMHELHI